MAAAKPMSQLLPPVEPPFNFEEGPLVTARNVELGTDRLSSAINWLTKCVQQHQQFVVELGVRVDRMARGSPVLDAAHASIVIPATDGQAPMSNPAEGPVENASADVHRNSVGPKVDRLPRAVDLEEICGRLRVEVQHIAKESREEARKELMRATSDLSERLRRVTAEWSERLERLREDSAVFVGGVKATRAIDEVVTAPLETSAVDSSCGGDETRQPDTLFEDDASQGQQQQQHSEVHAGGTCVDANRQQNVRRDSARGSSIGGRKWAAYADPAAHDALRDEVSGLANKLAEERTARGDLSVSIQELQTAFDRHLAKIAQSEDLRVGLLGEVSNKFKKRSSAAHAEGPFAADEDGGVEGEAPASRSLLNRSREPSRSRFVTRSPTPKSANAVVTLASDEGVSDPVACSGNFVPAEKEGLVPARTVGDASLATDQCTRERSHQNVLDEVRGDLVGNRGRGGNTNACAHSEQTLGSPLADELDSIMPDGLGSIDADVGRLVEQLSAFGKRIANVEASLAAVLPIASRIKLIEANMVVASNAGSPKVGAIGSRESSQGNNARSRSVRAGKPSGAKEGPAGKSPATSADPPIHEGDDSSPHISPTEVAAMEMERTVVGAPATVAAMERETPSVGAQATASVSRVARHIPTSQPTVASRSVPSAPVSPSSVEVSPSKAAVAAAATAAIAHESAALKEELAAVLGRLASVEAQQQTFEQQQRKMAARASNGAIPSLTLADMQAELERVRRLFEFVEGVLPKDAQEAMRFFSSRYPSNLVAVSPDAVGGFGEDEASITDAAVKALGAEVEMERHRAKLEGQVREHRDALQREFVNLTTIVKVVQRDLGSSASMSHDLAARISRLEACGNLPAAGPATPACVADVSPVDTPAASGKNSLSEAVEGLRNDVRNWLDALHSSMLLALQQKADLNEVQNALRQAAVAAAAAGDRHDSEAFATLAKRSLVGRCASCDSQLGVDITGYKRPQPVPGPPCSWPSSASAGAKVAIRPPDMVLGKSSQYLSASSGKLPKIPEPRSKDFPKGRILKNSSQPDLRKHAPETSVAEA
mmetsp:Transcript_18386/g.52685  ORF Transcript_18386/g.52685 Transcript_18386/m.52685 type:complete len:1059 (+) Transcript_18386:112-3288(+)